MQTLFDLSTYHVEPAPDPNQPTYREYLALLEQAETERDYQWLQWAQHWLIFHYQDFKELEFQRLMMRWQRAFDVVRSAMEVG